MTNSSGNHFWVDGGHTIIRLICQGIYLLLGGVYDILLQISKSEIISSGDIVKFYARVQLIIGIFMLFRLSFSIIQGIINPDKFMDSKKGFGSLIVKVITALVLLTLIVPIKMPPGRSLNSYETKVRDNGILFGTLYEFQNRVLDQEVLAKLFLGVESGSDSLKGTGSNLSTIVVRAFFTPNLRPGSDTKPFIVTYADTKSKKGKKAKYKKSDIGKYKHAYLYCNVYKDQKDDDGKAITDFSYAGEVSKAYKKYYSEKSTSTDILNMINQGCDSEYDSLSGYDSYAFNFNWFAGLVVGILFLIVLVLMCLEIAKRAIKLALLRLIAPIPIISYMNPDSDFQNGALGAWIKTLTTTYLELFFHLLVIFFAIFVIQSISSHGGLDFDGTAGIFAKIFVYLGLILFAKDAPKFLKQALGIKEDAGSGLFKGLGQIRRAAGIGAGIGASIGGGIGSAATNFRASRAEHPSVEGQGVRNFGRKVLAGMSGIAGGLSGVGVGTKAAIKAKDHNMAAARDAQNQRNALRAAHSTAMGRAADRAAEMFTGNSLAEADQRKYDTSKEAAGALKDYKSMLQEQARKSGKVTGRASINGRQHRFNYERLTAAMNAKDANGNFKYGGETYNVRDFDTNKMNEILDSQSEDYRDKWASGFITDDKLDTQYRNTEYATKQAGIDVPTDYGDIGRAIGDATNNMADMSTDMKHIKRRANTRANKK